jgi:serine/threonine protein kinase
MNTTNENSFTGAHSRGKKTVQRTNSVLGSGSYGEVSVVKHKGICYAAKELKLEDSALVDNLYREAANLALLDDDNIVKFCGIGVYEKHHRQGVFLILTELLATSLHRYLMKGVGISLPNQVSLLSQVLSGLEYMHQAPSVIHGDPRQTERPDARPSAATRTAQCSNRHCSERNIKHFYAFHHLDFLTK